MKDVSFYEIIISNIGQKINWNQSHFKYYRTFTDVLSLLALKETDD